MQIHRLRLVNFRQHEDTELSLGAGLTGIIGPNGAGKTTLLEAIAFAIYGTPAARGTRESIRRRGAPPRSPVRVELDFALGAHHYRVVRGLNTAELYQNGDPEPIANSLGTVTERLTRLLGMSRDEFFNTYFTGQKELAVMAQLSAPERAQFLSRVLGYERLRVAQDRLKVTRSELRARVQALQSGLPDAAQLDVEEQAAAALIAAAAAQEETARAAREAAEQRWSEVSPRWEAMLHLRESVQSLDGDIRLAEHQVGAARERFQSLDRQLAEALTARSRLAEFEKVLAPLAALRAERQALDQGAEASTRRATGAAQLEEVRASLQEHEQRIARLPGEEVLQAARARVAESREALARIGDQVEERRTAWVRDLQDARTKRQTLLDQYKELKEQQERIVAAGHEGACPTCARPLGADFEVVLGVLDRQLQDVLFNGNFYRQRIEQLEDEPAELTELDRRRDQAEQEATQVAAELGRLELQLQEAARLVERRQQLAQRVSELEAALAGSGAAYDQARHQEVRRLLGELEPKALLAERLRGAAERAELLIPEAEAAERHLSEREGALQALRRHQSELGFSSAAFEAAREAAEVANDARRVSELRLVEARGERATAEESGRGIARRRADRASREAEAKVAERELLLAQELDRALTDLRTDLNATLRPDLSELASVFLLDLTNGRYTDLELDESYVPAVLEDGEIKPVISGGEEDVANLALRLAISQMIAERAGQPLSLLVLDEIFGSLDEERRASVLNLLRSLADRFPQVILITHIEAVREGFDRIIRVRLDEERRVSVVQEDAQEVGAHDVAA
ncbi:MAG TPA: SMC family ATPase [Gemmatimonadales bacterium]|nr:SMC family ATPase [Gemmatimonadales bacterium]